MLKVENSNKVKQNYSNSNNYKFHKTEPMPNDSVSFKGGNIATTVNKMPQKKTLLTALTASLASLGAIFSIKSKDVTSKGPQLIDYPINLPDDATVILPNGETLDLKEALANANEYGGAGYDKKIIKVKECEQYVYGNKYKKLKKIIPDLRKEVGGMKRLLSDEVHIETERSYGEDKLFAEPNSVKEGNTKVYRFGDIPLYKIVEMNSIIPNKFIEIPKDSTIVMNGEQKKVDKDSVITYHAGLDDIWVQSKKEFLTSFHPGVTPQSEQAFLDMYNSMDPDEFKPDTLGKYTTLNGKEFDDISKGYKYKNLIISAYTRTREDGYYFRPNDSVLDCLSEYYDKCLAEYPHLNNYNMDINIYGNVHGYQYRIYLKDKNAKPWDDKGFKYETDYNAPITSIPVKDWSL